MLLPNPPWYRRWPVILAGVIGLAAISAMLGWRGLQQVASPSTTVTSQTPATVPTTVTAPPTSARRQAPTTRAPGVLWSRRGTDVGRSPVFRAPPNWRIVWSFDCSNFKDLGGGNFKITGDGAFRRVDIQRTAVEDSGSRSVPGGGIGYLVIESVCDSWTVKALAS
jgi:hypothetical protein